MSTRAYIGIMKNDDDRLLMALPESLFLANEDGYPEGEGGILSKIQPGTSAEALRDAGFEEIKSPEQYIFNVSYIYLIFPERIEIYNHRWERDISL